VNPVDNPFAPGAGRRPPELAGRDDDLARFEVLLLRTEAGKIDRGIVHTGLRGVGKTVLLNEYRAAAERREWVVGKVEAGVGRSFRHLASQALNRSLRAAGGRFGTDRLRGLLAVFKAFTLKVAPDGSLALGIDVDAASARGNTGDLETDLTELLTDLGTTVAELGTGALLLIDEMQDLDRSEREAIAGACHEIGQRDLPVVVVGAGLPNLPGVLAEARSYAERLFEYRTIGALEPAAAEAAITRPTAALGVTWEPDALEALLDATIGYPYFLQVYGRQAWDYAASNPIDHRDVRVGMQAARHELDGGFFGSRWDRVSARQRDYLRAMAEVAGDEPVATADVATHLGLAMANLSVARDQLIRKGLLYAPERGVIAFTVPGMAEFILRQAAQS
jgi:AAA ATPase domain